jgi:hypothetical protein
MADLDIDDKIAELTLGHKIKGIEAVYNRSDYIEKKSAALDRFPSRTRNAIARPRAANSLSAKKLFDKD